MIKPYSPDALAGALQDRAHKDVGRSRSAKVSKGNTMPDKSKHSLEPHQVDRLVDIAQTFHWMARRYADGRMSYATSLFNECVRSLLAMGIELNPTQDGTIWARDSMGRAYDKLTDEEAQSDAII